MVYSNATLTNILTNKEVSLLDSLYSGLPEDSVSDKLYKLRKINGLSLEAFAGRIDRSISAVKSWEDGEITPTQTSIKKVCTAFELDITDFS